MEESIFTPHGMVVTPHHLATQSAIAILKEGGTAMEAVIAAAATIAVVYPHMNGIGGDGFWLIVPPHEEPFVIEACGAAGSLADHNFFKDMDKIPYTGPKSAITVAGTVGGWQEALNYVTECGYQRISAARLLADAINYAENGYPISKQQENELREFIKHNEISNDFERVFMPDGWIPRTGEKFIQKKLAKTLKHLAENGFNSFYKGKLAQKIANDMKFVGIPIIEKDLAEYNAIRKVPLRLLKKHGHLFSAPPPAQGLVSLSILGILNKLKIDGKQESKFIHAAVEATKQAFELRDQYITDPAYMKTNPQHLLSDTAILKMAQNVNLDKASKIGKGNGETDTIWLGIMDNKGFSISFIQSIYHGFGSGVVLPKSGILWHNRGTAFTLQKDHILCVKPGKKPYHTLSPAAAKLNDGRVMVYGTRGGDGQPQTQSAIFHRYVVQRKPLQKSVSAPRWLFGRTVGDTEDSLKLENRFSEETVNYLKERGHDVVMLGPFSERMGDAGALVRHPSGIMEGAYDPRGCGSAAGF